MSLSDLDERDIDRLADHVAGVLDPPAAAEVAALIQTDPVWAGAFAELVGADAAVRGQLRAYGQAPVDPMPPDVVARIDAALAVAAADPTPAVASVIPLDAARRARRRRFAGLAAAAAVLIAVGTGVVVQRGVNLGSDRTATGAADSAGGAAQNDTGGEGSAANPPALPQQGIMTTHSGQDYSAESLAAAARTAGAGKSATRPGPNSSASPGLSRPNDAALGRLDDPDALESCLHAILGNHPGQVLSVDLARYEGAPAVIVVISQPAATIAVAAGDRCGLDGADELAVETA